MPGTDGYAFIRAVRALPADEGARHPAVALTALVRDEDRRRAIDAGYQSHMAKPVTREALMAPSVVYTHLEVQRDDAGRGVDPDVPDQSRKRGQIRRAFRRCPRRKRGSPAAASARA